MINYEDLSLFLSKLNSYGVKSQFSELFVYNALRKANSDKTYDVYDIGCGYGGCALMANKFLKTNKTYLIDPLETGKYIINTTKEIIVKTYDEVLEKEELPNNYVRVNDITEIDKIKSKHNIFFIDTMNDQRDFLELLKIGIKKNDIIAYKENINTNPYNVGMFNKFYKEAFIRKLIAKYLFEIFKMTVKDRTVVLVAKDDFVLKDSIELIDVANKEKIQNILYGYTLCLSDIYNIEHNFEYRYIKGNNSSMEVFRAGLMKLFENGENLKIYNRFKDIMDMTEYKININGKEDII